ncbi:MAG TPA: sulfurtransferase [Aggregatilinea sp.]|jgi:thiosulfate/3-mercaptopyruvate sulfurtransferase|uniref:sulfurtransferase n=1 Tax=Aggregatilinea sp. TaxID=2806333 RepID=UPI002B83868C|nr:sulfurtransferase [Aggregatilinea sp.]HML24734.1 sulfurtransferase [Aggregatilinea sp.]
MTAPLVSTQWVADHLNQPGIRLVEVDVVPFKYQSAGHLRGAVSFDWTSQLQDPTRRDIISPSGFERLLSDAGITNDDHVIIYGDQNNWFAAYGFWLFSLYGHTNLSLMDGGRLLWIEEKREIIHDIPQFPRSDYRVHTINPEIRADRQFILDRLEQSDTLLLDVRSENEFAGEWVAPIGDRLTAHRGGHIPGAHNLPWSRLMNEDGTFLGADAMRRILAAEGIDLGADEIVTYCFIGERAAHTWFALKYILGCQNVRNYDGSWTEWGNGIGLPITQGVA